MPAFKNAIQTLGNAANGSVFVAPAGAGTIITSASFCNTSNAPATLHVSVTDTSAASTKFVAKGINIPVGGTFSLKPEVQLILEPTDVLNAWTDQVSVVDSCVSATVL